MGKLKLEKTPIDGLYIIEPTVFGDSRGYFVETYNRRDMEELGLDLDFVQDSQSMSYKGTLRGLHFQKQHPQAKIVRVIRGTVYDVAVALRSNSKTFGQWFGLELSENNNRQLLIGKGFAHGFLTVTDTATVCYKATDFYHPGDEGGIAWNDPGLGIDWPGLRGVYKGSPGAEGYSLADGTPLILSEKDQKWPCMKEAYRF